MTIKATIKRIKETVQVSDRFKKRIIHVETVEQYPQTLEIQLTQDKTSLVDSFAEGQTVDISLNLRGREWDPNDGSEMKVFNTIEAWRISAAQ